MEFRIANSFTDSLGKLTAPEANAAKRAAFDLQVNPSNPGLQQHRVDKTKDKRFWSVRVNKDIRIITHRADDSVLLCYADHHDEAYRWAQRRRLEVHPRTGAAQMVVIEETTREVVIPTYVEQVVPVTRSPLFASTSSDDLLKYGVPEEWLERIGKINRDEELLELIDVLPEEAIEALLTLAEGKTPEPTPVSVPGTNPFEHPDAQRRFRTLDNVEELKAALEYPWEKWTVFLHPAQRSLVEREFNGPARVSGSAGTGKTIVALHRATELAKQHPDARVLLTTYSDTLATALKHKLLVLEAYKPHVRERVEIRSIREVAERLYRGQFQSLPNLIDVHSLQELLKDQMDKAEHKFSDSFIYSEWRDIVDDKQVESLDEYLNAERVGRKRSLSQKQRETLWPIFQATRAKLATNELLTEATMYRRVREALNGKRSPFNFVVVDEAQDLSVQQLRMLAVLGTTTPQSLFFAGDMGQRIFQLPFSWKSLGINIQGRCKTLKVNYRTSHQIRRQADRLLDPKLRDVDGVEEDRSGTVSLFNGIEPAICLHTTEKDEVETVSKWIIACIDDGIQPEEICLTTRDDETQKRALAASTLAKLSPVVLKDHIQPNDGCISVCQMEQIKGLEFRAVAVLACDDGVVPSQKRLDFASENSDFDEIYNTERRLLYVACTRARDRLLLTSKKPESEFLSDLAGEII